MPPLSEAGETALVLVGRPGGGIMCTHVTSITRRPFEQGRLASCRTCKGERGESFNIFAMGTLRRTDLCRNVQELVRRGASMEAAAQCRE